MKSSKYLLCIILLGATFSISAKVSLDSCRRMAIANNKQLKIANTKITRADYQRKQARAAYFPSIDAEGTYTYNQKKLALIEEDAKLPTMTFDPVSGKYNYNIVTDAQGAPVIANGQPVPSQVALLPKSALTYDIHNVFAGAITLTQPIYMGGKIRALNKISHYAEEIARHERDLTIENIIYEVDAAYWQVISLQAKEKLAQSYVLLLDTLHANVKAMLAQGVATRSDELSVAVKQNAANVDLIKVKNGVSLARMQLAQLCGLPITEPFTLEDENKDIALSESPVSEYNMTDVFARRNDVKALQLAVNVYEQNSQVARSSMLPQLAVVGAYSITNPNSFNGFKNEFGGMFSVGAMIKIPIWHWGGNYNKYRAAKTDVVISKLTLDDAKEKITLQVNQASFKMQEAIKIHDAMQANLDNAEENLRTARIGFSEGVLTSDDVMAAQTAWLKAHSEAIDASIDVRLCKVYLNKVLGKLNNYGR